MDSQNVIINDEADKNINSWKSGTNFYVSHDNEKRFHHDNIKILIIHRFEL